ncbi:hypothetical protein, partial [Bacteroides uniformis]|uniref:hypothetical protein n=1 Tax=Bacteroides uniformis TaxID=820 RepID=UPI001C70A000
YSETYHRNMTRRWVLSLRIYHGRVGKAGIAEAGQGTGWKSGTGRETHCGNEKGKENVKR